MLNWLLQASPLVIITITAVGAMIVGSIIRLATLKSLPKDRAASRLASLKTWWILLALLLTASWLGPTGVVVLLALASGLALDEFLKLTSPKVSPTARRLWLATMLLAGYGTLLITRDRSFQVVLPMVAVWSLVLPHILEDSTRGYLDHVGQSLWGVMVLVWGVCHAGWLVFRTDLPRESTDAVGWFFLLVFLTELNDIAQALVGRRWGKHPILPRISPNKTWEGLLGGLLVTTIASGCIAPWVAPGLSELSQSLFFPSWLCATLGGLVISLSGLIGDLNISCVKRDVGVKDGSQMLPGQGGVIDRIDSLSFTAPAFSFYLSLWLLLSHWS